MTVRSALLVSETMTTGIEPRRLLPDPECRAERLGFALGGLAAELGGDRIGAKSVARARFSAATARRLVAIAIVPMVALTAWWSLASEQLERPVASALYWSYQTAVPMAIGLCWWVRRPASRFGPLLVELGILAWMVSWASPEIPLTLDEAVLVGAPYVVLTFYLFLAFPTGRLLPVTARWLMGVLALAMVAVGPATQDTLAWGVVGAQVLLPPGFLLVLLRAEWFAVGALQKLVVRLASRPTPQQWRGTIAAALADPSLRLGFYDQDTERFFESDGAVLMPPRPGSGRSWVPVDRDARPVAALVIDETLAEDPGLVRAAASATLLAVENGHLEGELVASRKRILEAGHAERRRIERDLHDSAQQRLVALRIQLALAGERLVRSEDRTMLERLGVEVDEAIDELRTVAHGIYPPILADQGIGAALASVARSSAMPVGIRDGWLGRHSEAVETTVYFCCLEGLQNAAKHAGHGASATIRLSEADGWVSFSVEDDGAGFDPDDVERGAGLTNLTDRVTAVGGTLQIDGGPGRGTHIRGEIPFIPIGPCAAGQRAQASSHENPAEA